MNAAAAIDALTECGALKAALDAEHDYLETTLKMLETAVLKGVCGNVILRILDMSADFCALHFTHEENFFREHGFEGTDAHAAHHGRLREKLLRTRQAAAGADLPLATLDALDLLADFRRHIEECDRAAYEDILAREPVSLAALPATGTHG